MQRKQHKFLIVILTLLIGACTTNEANFSTADFFAHQHTTLEIPPSYFLLPSSNNDIEADTVYNDVTDEELSGAEQIIVNLLPPADPNIQSRINKIPTQAPRDFLDKLTQTKIKTQQLNPLEASQILQRQRINTIYKLPMPRTQQSPADAPEVSRTISFDEPDINPEEPVETDKSAQDFEAEDSSETEEESSETKEVEEEIEFTSGTL